MASSSSSSTRTWRYDVFPSFSGADVRKTFLSHFLEKLQGKSIITFIDNRIERSRTIELELLLAIRQSMISIVIFSKKYVSSTWCLNELVEIHECHEESKHMVIPIFYGVDPSHVRKQIGEFGKAFENTCEGKSDDCVERWKKALVGVAGLAGHDSQNWSGEAEAIEVISKDVLNKLLITPCDDFRDDVGIEAHIEAIMDSKLCLESGGVRMVGILGPLGIGKTTIAGALYSRISRQFDHRVFVSYKRAVQGKMIADLGMKLSWANDFLSKILCQKDLKIESLGVVEQRLKHRKVLIVLDDVDEIELLETLVGHIGWFGFGSRIVVVTEDRALLESHEINLIYEVQLPSREVAVQMFCRSAFRQNSRPDGFMELAVEVAELAGNLPLGLSVLGSSLRGKDKKSWVEMMPRLRNGLDGKIEKTLRFSYDGLDENDDQDIFVYVACLFNGENVNFIKNLLDTIVNNRLRTLADKSLLRITAPHETVQMHTLLEKLGREIVRAESINIPGKRRFLVNVEDISDVFYDNSGTENVLGIRLNTQDISEPLFIGENSFKGMCNLQFIKFDNPHWWRGGQETDEVRLYLPQGLVYLPHKLRLLHWDGYPAKYIPPNFIAEHLVEISMRNSKLEKLWEGALPLRRLKKIDLSGSTYLKEIPDLSNATNLEILSLSYCTSLVALPSSIRNLNKLICLAMFECSNLEVLPADVNLESLVSLYLRGCSRLRTFPRISKNISRLQVDGTAMEEEDCSWIENISGLTFLNWENCPLKCMPLNFNPEHLTELRMRESNLEKLWEGVQWLGSLKVMDLKNSRNLKELPDLSKAINLKELDLSGCESLKEISDLSKATGLSKLILSGCKNLKKFPNLSNVTSLLKLELSGCKNLKKIQDISKAINIFSLVLSECEILKEILDLLKAIKLYRLDLRNCTSLVTLPSSIQYIHKLTSLNMNGCTNLEVLPTNINLVALTSIDLDGCSRLTSFPQLSTSIEKLILSHTAIEEVPSWIENIIGLTTLLMSGCKKLRKISATIWNLKHLECAEFIDCGGLTSVSDASRLVKTRAELHAERTENYLMNMYTSCSCSKTKFKFGGCFKLDRDAHKFILQSDSCTAVLPGNQVPTYFTHQSCGSSVIVPLPQSSLSQQVLRFKACIISRAMTDFQCFSFCIKVHWKFKGVTGMCNINVGSCSYETDHLVGFHFDICPSKEVHDPPSQLDCNNVEFEFEHQITDLSFNTFHGKIEGYGVRVLNAIPSLDSDDRSSEVEYTDQSGESDAETERCKKRMRMAVVTSPEPSNSLYGQSAETLGLMAPNLDK